MKEILDEVERCRPFMLVLLGDRYGFVPHPAQLPEVARRLGCEAAAPHCGQSTPATSCMSSGSEAPSMRCSAATCRSVAADSSPHSPQCMWASGRTE